MKEIRYYEIEDRGERFKLPSVTSIIDLCYPKPWLAFWRGKIGNEEANQVSKEAADKGQDLHGYIRMHLQGIPYSLAGKPEEFIRDFTSAKNWAEDTFGDSSLETEKQVYCTCLGYAGTLDCIGMTKDGKIAIVDWKTSKSLHGDYPIQLAAYAHAYAERNAIEPELGFIVRVKAGIQTQKISKDEIIKRFSVFKSMLPIFHYYKQWEERNGSHYRKGRNQAKTG